MDQTYMFSKSLDRDYDKSKDNVDLLNDNSGEIAPKLINPNREYPHILDIKHQARNLSIIKLRELLILKQSEASQEESKALTEHSYLVCEDRSDLSIKMKYLRVSDRLRDRIICLYSNKNKSRSEISQKLFVPYSTVCRIIRQSQECHSHWEESDRSKILESKISRDAKFTIESFILLQQSAYSSRNIQLYLEEKLGSKYSKHRIIDFMKKDLHLSYKK